MVELKNTVGTILKNKKTVNTVPKLRLISTLQVLSKKIIQANNILDEIIDNPKTPVETKQVAQSIKESLISMHETNLIEINVQRIANLSATVIDERSFATWLISWIENRIIQVIVLKQSLAER